MKTSNFKISRKVSVILILSAFLLPAMVFSQTSQITAPPGTPVIMTNYPNPVLQEDPIFIFCSPDAAGNPFTGTLSVVGGYVNCTYNWTMFNPANNLFEDFGVAIPSGFTSTINGLSSGFYQCIITCNAGTSYQSISCCRAHVFVNETILTLDPLTSGCDTFDLGGGQIGAVSDFIVYEPPTSSFVVDSSTQITVCFTGEHTFVSDLGFYLIGPGGGRVDLLPSVSTWDDGAQVTTLPPTVLSCTSAQLNTNCNSGNNFSDFCFTTSLPYGDPAYTACICDMATPLTGTFASAGPWNAVYGDTTSQGGWAVQVYDCVAADVGFISQVTITFVGINQYSTSNITYDSDPIFINDNSCTPQTASIYIVPQMSNSSYIIHDSVTAVWSSSPTVWNPAWGSTDFATNSIPHISPVPATSISFYLAAHDHLVDPSGNEITGYTACSPVVSSFFITNSTSSSISFFPANICSNAQPVQIIPVNWGGTWSALPNSTSISAGGLFFPGNAFIGPNYITYSFGGFCPSDTTFTINVVSSPVASGTVEASINGGSNGAINLTMSGGTQPYTCTWSDGSSSQNLQNIPAGTYYVTVTDVNGCSSTSDYIVNNVTPCPWTYINTGNNHTIVVPSNSSLTINGIPVSVGDYLGVFYDSLGALKCGGYMIWEGITYAFPAWGADLGNDGFAAGESFKWKIWDISTGTDFDAYAVYDTSFPSQGFYVTNGMSGLISLSNQLPVLVVTYISNNVTCNNANNGSISLTVTGGSTPYSYQWSNGTSTADITGLTAGMYDVTVSDALGLIVSQSIQITQPDQLQVSITPSGSDSLQATVTGGTSPFTYSWSGGENSQIITVISSGVYSVSVMDSNGCSTDVSYDFNLMFSISGQLSGSMKNTVHCAVLLINKPDETQYKAVDFMISTDGNYIFDSISGGNYMVYAIPDPSDATVNLPSYYGDKLHWSDASVINIIGNTSDINISLGHYNPSPVGIGSIRGFVYYDSWDFYETSIYDNNWFGGSSSFTDKSNKARNIPVMILDQNQLPAGYTLTDENGYFQFAQLSYGDYSVYTEKAGFVTYPVEIEINEENPHFDNIIINITSSGINGFYSLPDKKTDINIYPNPANKLLFLNIQLPGPDVYDFTIINSLGSQMCEINYSLVKGINTVLLPVSSCPDGLYHLLIHSKSAMIGNEKFMIIR